MIDSGARITISHTEKYQTIGSYHFICILRYVGEAPVGAFNSTTIQEFIMSLNLQQAIALACGVGSAAVLALSQMLSAGMTLPLQITSGTLALVTAVLAAVAAADKAPPAA